MKNKIGFKDPSIFQKFQQAEDIDYAQRDGGEENDMHFANKLI